MMRRAGLTLAELLVVVFILGVLFAVALPALHNSVRRGWTGAEISALRQIGAAGQLYASDHDGVLPMAARQLYPRYVSERSLFHSKLDLTPNGYANELIRQEAAQGKSNQVPADFPITYVGLGDIGWRAVTRTKFIGERPGQGWLISFTPNPEINLTNMLSHLCKPYRRLGNDGSVREVRGGLVDGCCGIAWHYADFTDEEKRASCLD